MQHGGMALFRVSLCNLKLRMGALVSIIKVNNFQFYVCSQRVNFIVVIIVLFAPRSRRMHIQHTNTRPHACNVQIELRALMRVRRSQRILLAHTFLCSSLMFCSSPFRHQIISEWHSVFWWPWSWMLSSSYRAWFSLSRSSVDHSSHTPSNASS